jgi:phosphohistidine swiveling domain-containing protein
VTASGYVVSLEKLIGRGFYPGYEPRLDARPHVAEPLAVFGPDDEDRFWLRDSMHFGEGLTPASLALLEDAQTWGTQIGAEVTGIPPTAGMVNRLAGVHVYIGQIPITSGWQVEARGRRFGPLLGERMADFAAYWQRFVDELEAGFQHFDRLDPDAMTRDEVWQALRDAYAFHRRGWAIHFEVMYLLAANYLGLYGLAADLGLDVTEVPRWLAGERTSFLATDERLWSLAVRARDLDLDRALTDGPEQVVPEDVRARVTALPGGERWWQEFVEFLATWGHRTDETCTIDRPSWAEHPVTPLATIREYLTAGETHDFGAAQRQVLATRDALVDAAREKIGDTADRDRFDAALAANRAANFVWWNEEHNFLIDRRIHLPVRYLSLALARYLVAEGALAEPEDVFFLFKHELYDAMGGRDEWARLAALVPSRRDYYECWRARGDELPPMVGSVPEVVQDPLMTEIFGLTPDYLATIRRGLTTAELRGMPASGGVVVGIARVVGSAREIDQIRAGEVLVCGGTTTEWTPAFGIIAAAVTDTGGSLAHTAIISREYGIPCVVGTAVATSTIRTGDKVRVDGDNGVVQVLRPRSL